MIFKRDRNGNTITYTYDSLNRMTAKRYPDGTSTTFSYDLNGNIITASNPDVSYTFIYNALNRIVSVTNTTIGKTVNYAYICCGLKGKMTDPEGGVTNYSYDALKRLVRLTNPSGETTTYIYDNPGRLTRKGMANGTYSTYSYDTIGRLLTLSNNNSSGSPISTYSYTYDNVGNRISMTTSTGTHNYTYDRIYQLTRATHPDSPQETYTYDPVGNRLSSADFTNWRYDSNNRLLSYGGISLTYDNNGNTTSRSDGTLYAYDYENRLKRIDHPDGRYSEYKYDPFGNRILKDDNGSVTWFVYDLTKGDLADVIAEYDNSGNLLVRYTHGNDVDEVISMRRDGESYYYLRDGLGSVTGLVDSSQLMSNTYGYDGFGNVVSQSETVVNPYGFTGRELDTESELMYYRARYYNSGVGRFVTADPIGFRGGVNFYVYVRNNPVNRVDPWGLAYFAKRPIEGVVPWLGPASCNPIDDVLNTEISHEQLFFEDGKYPPNIGFFSDGTLKTEPNPTGYRCRSGHYDDCIMRKAVQNVPLRPYCLLGQPGSIDKFNCQDWAEAARQEYNKLVNDPKVKCECKK